MSAIKVTCSYRSNGCPVLVYVLSAAAHESLCPHAPHVRCMVAYCPWSGGYDDVFQHVAAEHQFSAYDLMVTYMILCVSRSRSWVTPAFGRDTCYMT
ncbi:E3 ubiquitin-protein ligase sina-like isoform X2 [Aphis craccivora]|uniref:E3 ubiquitin-protein ligase sina-like isoform X2 n=1 Tax=Aphis craccivora TaxID=307492 RepID=A0A6G0ZHC6_APHCR|nr:E3 ubiquitin-protein ligase sina-like isoform X2 [Aphis craccivora]